MISQRPFLLLRIRFPGRPIFIQFVPMHVMDLWKEAEQRSFRSFIVSISPVASDLPHTLRMYFLAARSAYIWMGVRTFLSQVHK